MKPQYQIDLPAFIGPLELLLHLIDRQELDITAISLVEVTEQYLTQVETLKEGRIDHLIDFLVIGARLVLIKSRALLPQSPHVEVGLNPDEAEEEDPAEALVRQLKEYKQFKTAASWLAEREMQGFRTYLRVAPPPKLEGRLDLSGLTVEMMKSAVLAALARVEKLEDSVAVVLPRQITIEGQIGRLREKMQKKQPFLFQELLSLQSNRVEVAVSLLAVLELLKRQEIWVTQPYLFGPIEILPNNGSKPPAPLLPPDNQ